MRLGTGPRLFSQPKLRTYDTRLPFQARRLSVSLVCLADMISAARHLGLGGYRMASQLLPVLGEADLDGYRRQLDDCLGLAEWLGIEARAAGLRLTVHPALDVVFGSDDGALVRRGVALATAWSLFMDAAGMGPEACIVVHRGGAGQHGEAGFRRAVLALPQPVRARLALEHDERQCSLPQALRLGDATGVPVVWDYLHWRCWNADGRTAVEAWRDAAASWPAGVTPKVHFSSPSTAARANRPPQAREHAEYIDPFSFRDFAATVDGECDVMLEARGKDLAVAKLRLDLGRPAIRDGAEVRRGAFVAAG